MKKNNWLKICLCIFLFSALLSNNLVFANDEEIKDKNIVSEKEPLINEDITQKPNIVEEKSEDKVVEVEKEETLEQKQKKVEPKSALKALTIWDGSKDISWFSNDKEVYEISTPSQLAGLAELVNNGNKMTNITFRLTNDIYLNDEATPKQHLWPMIGKNTANHFAGSIDGQNHTVFNVYVNETTTNFAGFLGQAFHAEPLKNIIITGSITGKLQAGVIGFISDSQDATVTLENITNKADITGVSVGGIVTEATNLLIKNCINEGTIKGTSVNAGGILAYSYGRTEMINCHNKGNVTGPENTGGLIGHGGSMYISSSSNTGNINGNGYDVGGLVGKALGGKTTVQISNSTQTGNIWGWGSVGGIIGTNSGGLIKNCKNLGGKVESYYGNAGGIVGFQTVNSSFSEENWGSVISCSNKANVSTGNDATHSSKAGGIIGSTDRMNSIQDCVNEGSVTSPIKIAGGIIGQGNVSITRCQNFGSIKVNGGGLAGGVRGYGQGAIDNSANSGDVTATGDYVGGIQGDDSVATIMNSENNGNIKGNNFVGGIAGYNNKLITNSTNKGNVTGVWYIGGIVGYGQANISNCENLTGEVTGVYRTGGIIGQSIDATATIQDCTNKGIVNGNEFVGGIVAHIIGDKIISGCVNQGEIKVNSNSSVVASRFGGITGYANNGVKINDCINEGVVRANGNWTGGIVGSSGAQLTNCINKGNMYFGALSDSNSTEAITIGLIVGWSNGTITGCTNEGDLEVLLKADYYTINNGTKGVDYDIGGISGLISSTKITDCVNKGNIYVTRNNRTKTNYHDYTVGGISGYASNSTVDKSCNFGNIQTEEKNGVVDYTDQFYIGGIVSKASKNSVINECINSGELRTNIGRGQVGGITAASNPADITNCISAGNLYSDTTDAVFLSGITLGFNSTGKMENVYFIGGMHLLDDKQTNVNCLAGIAGNITYPENISNAYYNIDNTPYTLTNQIASATVRGLHTSEMIGKKAKEIMMNFDFDKTWIMNDDKIETNNNIRYYPSLRSNQDIKNGVKFYLVSFVKGVGYEIGINDTYDKAGFVLPNEDYEFTLKIKDTHKDMDYIVKDNGVKINSVTRDGVYKLSNVQQDHNITVEFKKIAPSVTFPSEVTIQYGDILKDAKFEFIGKGKMNFKEADKKVTVNESGQKFIMIFTPEDVVQYESVEKEVTVYVLPKQTSRPKDIHIVYAKELKLSDIVLPKGWSWKYPTSIVQVGTHTYEAFFHDEEGNYLDEINIEIKISMDKEEITPPDINPSEPNDPTEPNKPIKPTKPSLPVGKVETGDTSSFRWYTTCVLLALGGMFMVKVSKIKKKN